jgi:acyl-CoA reductase-like NAD-dependent aldehyde dehydrogenase
VLDDADLDEAVNAAPFGAFLNQGQICMSTERLVADARIADDFVARFVRKAAALPASDPRGGNVVLGSLIGRELSERVEALAQDAVAKAPGCLPADGVTAPSWMRQSWMM